MRRTNYEYLDHYKGLVLDCLYYCWQIGEITDDEFMKCYEVIDFKRV